MSNKYNPNLISALQAFSYSDFIRTDEPNNPIQKIHNNQLDAAIEIVKSFTKYTNDKDEHEFNNRHILLLAQMQSGKTGTISGVINVLKKVGWDKTYFVNPLTHKGIEKYFIISGMNDNGLHEQTTERIMYQAFDANEDKNVDSGSKDNVKTDNPEFVIFKNFDLRKDKDGKMKYKLENCVVFIDESHYASGQTSVLTKFIEDSGIDWKNTDELKKRNVFIVSVSATSFKEIYNDVEFGVDSKTKIILRTSEQYKGVVDFDDNNQIINGDKKDFQQKKEIIDGSEIKISQIEKYIMDAHSRMLLDGEKGVIFIRVQKLASRKVILNNTFIKNNFKCVSLDSSKGNVDYAQVGLEIKAMKSNFDNDEKPLIFFIKGSFRAGITLDERFKDLTYMVYDYSIELYATPQGLLGRLCGYRSNPHFVTRTKFYVHEENALQYADWVRDDFSDSKTPVIPIWVDFADLSMGDQLKLKETDIRAVSKHIITHEKELTLEEIRYYQDLHVNLSLKERRRMITEKINEDYTDIDFTIVGELYLKGYSFYEDSTRDRWYHSEGNSLRPDDKSSDYREKTNNNKKRFTIEDIGIKFIHLALDDERNMLLIHHGIIDRSCRSANKARMKLEHMITE